MPPVLILPADLRRRILTHLRAAVPREGVGLLAAKAEPGEPVLAVAFYAGSNRDASPTRYTMPPEEVLVALQEMETNGWRLGAIVHSHPAGPATPSPTDRREFRYPEALMVIVSLAGEPPDLRAWWFGEGTADDPSEVPVVDGVANTSASWREEQHRWAK